MAEYSVTVEVAVEAPNAVEARRAVVDLIEAGSSITNEHEATIYWVTGWDVEAL